MISATEALQLPTAQISDTEVDEVRSVLATIDAHIQAKMEFGGPPPLDIPFKRMSMAAAKVLVVVMKRFKWNVNANLMSEQSKFGGAATPHHWLLQFAPMIEIYDELLSGFEIEPKPQLM